MEAAALGQLLEPLLAPEPPLVAEPDATLPLEKPPAALPLPAPDAVPLPPDCAAPDAAPPAADPALEPPELAVPELVLPELEVPDEPEELPPSGLTVRPLAEQAAAPPAKRASTPAERSLCRLCMGVE
jgi:hypothetical protein